MAVQHLITADFFGSHVSIIDHDNQQWLTAEQAGRCLGYAEKNAGIMVNKLYRSHADEFTDEDVAETELVSPSGIQQTRIFSATGCQKLGFFARTPKAKDFRTWAAKVLAGRAPAALPSVAASLKMTRQKERIALEMFVAGHDIATIGKHLGVSRSTASLVLHGKYQFAPGAGAPECSPALIAAVAARHLAIEQARLAQMQERAAQRYLTSANNQALADALEQVGRHLQQAPALALSAQKGGE